MHMAEYDAFFCEKTDKSRRNLSQQRTEPGIVEQSMKRYTIGGAHRT